MHKVTDTRKLFCHSQKQLPNISAFFECCPGGFCVYCPLSHIKVTQHRTLKLLFLFQTMKELPNVLNLSFIVLLLCCKNRCFTRNLFTRKKCGIYFAITAYVWRCVSFCGLVPHCMHCVSFVVLIITVLLLFYLYPSENLILPLVSYRYNGT